jgi:predicted nucleic acid-binding protein
LAFLRPLLFDTSIMIPMIRGVAYEELFQRALRSGRARLSSVVMQELYAGTQSPADKRGYDGINRSFVSRGYMITPGHDDWTLSGTLLARYQQRYGAIEPRDHINDILIALCAINAAASLVTENTTDMMRWKEMLRRAGKRLSLRTVQRTDFPPPLPTR